MGQLADLGVSELVIVESPPAEIDHVEAWIDKLAERWNVAGRHH
jgi:hypothetical protein